MRGVRRACGDEAAHGARLGDALLEDLALRGLGVRQQQVVVDRFVLLALRRVDLHLAEQRVHSERACLVGDDRHDALAELLVAREIAQQAGERHRGADGLRAGTCVELGERGGRGQLDRLAVAHDALRDETVECAAALHHVLPLDGVLRGTEVRRVVSLECRLGDLVLHVQTLADLEPLVLRELLDLVRGVAALDAGPERPSLDGLAEDDRGAPGPEVVDGRLVRRVQLAVVVTTTRQLLDVVVGEVAHHLAQARVRTEEVLARVRAVLHGVTLELAVESGIHLVDEHSVDVTRKQVVPRRSPDDLDDVPPGAAEDRLELLDDLAVAAHRSVEALQVAVHDEDEVVEVLARRERDGAESLGLVGLTVAEERPHAALRGVHDLAVHEIAVVTGLVQRREWSESHRHRGELPEVRHQARVRVAGEAASSASDLAAEVVEVVLGQSSLEERARVHARCRMSLEVDVVARTAVVLAAEEVVEADLVQRCGTRERGEVTTDAVGRVVRTRHHDGGVPPDERSDAALDVLVAGEPRFVLARDGVDVRRRHAGREADLRLLRAGEQTRQQVTGAVLAEFVHDCIEGLEPLLSLARVGVG